MPEGLDPVSYRQMKVISLSLPRSGTTSMQDALGALGYNVHHLGVNWYNFQGDELLNRCTNAHYDNLSSFTGKPWTAEEWDELLGPFDAVTDLSGTMPLTFIKTYPEAMFVLVQWNFDTWVRSYDEALLAHLFGWQGFLFTFLVEPLAGTYIYRAMSKMGLGPIGVGRSRIRNREVLRRYYDDHHRKIRELVPKEQLLEFSLAAGWGPLCDFLGHEVPTQGFPHANDKESINEGWRYLRKLILFRAATRLALWAIPVVVAGAAVLIFRARGAKVW
ncbi:hypothetical protein CC79DRAFT_1342975 [Sarocladium strictum]